MIDSLTFIVPEYQGDIGFIQGISNVKTYPLKDGQVRSIGCLGNLKLTADYRGLIVSGSLATWVHESNVDFLTREQFKKAVIELGILFGIGNDIMKAQVWVIEIGATLRMDHPAGIYLNLHEDIPRFKRMSLRGESVYFIQKQRSLKLYDKFRQMKDSGTPVSVLQQMDPNLLRIEYKIQRRLTNHFGRKVTLGDLYKKESAKKLSGMLISMYDSILKSPVPVITEVGSMKTREFFNEIATAGMAVVGLDTCLGNIEAYRGSMPRARYYGMRKRVREINRRASLQGSDPLIDEVRRKLVQAAKDWICL